VLHKNGGDIGADCEERALTKGKLSAASGKNIESQDGDRVEDEVWRTIPDLLPVSALVDIASVCGIVVMLYPLHNVSPEETVWPEPQHEDDQRKRYGQLQLVAGARDVGADQVLENTHQESAQNGAGGARQSP
jgi:hypothetical protein